MKILFSILTIFLLSFQLMIKTAAVVWYKANQSYVATQLCENRDKPELKCNGRCVLAKKIAAAEQRENHFPYPSQIQVKIEPCVLETGHRLAKVAEIDLSKIQIPEWAIQPHSALIEGVFHPPQLV